MNRFFSTGDSKSELSELFFFFSGFLVCSNSALLRPHNTVGYSMEIFLNFSSWLNLTRCERTELIFLLLNIKLWPADMMGMLEVANLQFFCRSLEATSVLLQLLSLEMNNVSAQLTQIAGSTQLLYKYKLTHLNRCDY